MIFKSIQFYLSAVLLAVLCWSCGIDDTSQSNADNLGESRQQLAIEITTNYIPRVFSELQEKVEVLNSSLFNFKVEPTQENLSDLQFALFDTRSSWQKVSVIQFGPSETNGLHAKLNAFPIDEDEIESFIDAENYNVEAISHQNAVGFPAIDYLINHPEFTVDTIVSEARFDYLSAVVESIEANVNQTATEWTNGTYTDFFTSEAANGIDVGSALGILVNGIDINFQRQLRDAKFGIPAGVRSAGVARPNSVESLYGQNSVALAVACLDAYIEFFQGSEQSNISLVKYIGDEDQLNRADISDGIITHLQAARALTSNLPAQPLSIQVEQNQEAVVDVFLELQQAVTLIKSDMASAMGVMITNQDNDGD